jgi:hypothetical protein
MKQGVTLKTQADVGLDPIFCRTSAAERRRSHRCVCTQVR